MPTLDEILKAYGQIPDLKSFKRPMFVGPHPDDIEFGCGGLISSLKGSDAKITYVIVTDGGAGSSDPSITPQMMAETRKNEVLEAAKFMNIANVEFLNFEDGGDFSTEDVIKKLAPVILKYNPDVIFAPDSRLKTECHADHIKTGEAVRRLTQIVSHPEALRRQGVYIDGIKEFPQSLTLAFYFTDEANTKVEISEENLGEKIAALMVHKSQMQGPGAELLLNYFKLKALKLGDGKGFAEDYQVLIPLMQHVYSDGIRI